MTNPKYQVNISYVPAYKSGKTGVYATQSDGTNSWSGLVSTVDVYSGGYFQASMPEIKIYATGSSHITALGALMAIATASTTSDNGFPALGS